jgi:hypothetical protein
MTEKAIDRWERRNRGWVLTVGAIALPVFVIHLFFAVRALYDLWPMWALVGIVVSFALALAGLGSLWDDLEERPRKKGPTRSTRPDDC